MNYFLPKIYLCVCFALSIYSCNKNKPKNIISEDNFKDILVDLFLVEGTYSSLNSNVHNEASKTALDSLYKVVYKKHRTDSATFAENFDYYLNDKKKYLSLITSVKDTLQVLDSIAGIHTDKTDKDTTTPEMSADDQWKMFEGQLGNTKEYRRMKDSILNGSGSLQKKEVIRRQIKSK
jgi:hypothetical protein